MTAFAGKHVLLLGGTGSLGQALARHLLTGGMGRAERVVVLSRDEAKQHDMRLAWARSTGTSTRGADADPARRLQFRIGDVRNPASLVPALDGIDVVIHAAALKQVPTCEYFPARRR